MYSHALNLSGEMCGEGNTLQGGSMCNLCVVTFATSSHTVQYVLFISENVFAVFGSLPFYLFY